MIKMLQNELEKRTKLRSTSDAGFTLIELLVVILIIGILSGVVVIALGGTSKDATAKACSQNASNLYSAITNYQIATSGGNGALPNATGDALSGTLPIVSSTTYPTVLTGTAYTSTDLAALVPTYISKIPGDVVAYKIATSDGKAGVIAVVGPKSDAACTPAGI